MVYPPKGLYESRTLWGPFDVFPFYCGLEKGVWHFQITGGNSPFWHFENVLIPPRNSSKAEPNGVHSIWRVSILLGLSKGVWHFQFTAGNLPFWNLENVLFSNGMDGMDGWDIKSNLQFLHTLYIWTSAAWTGSRRVFSRHRESCWASKTQPGWAALWLSFWYSTGYRCLCLPIAEWNI